MSQLRPNGSRRIHAFHLSSLEVPWRCKTPKHIQHVTTWPPKFERLGTRPRWQHHAVHLQSGCLKPCFTVLHASWDSWRLQNGPERTRKDTLIQHGEGRVALHWKTWHIWSYMHNSIYLPHSDGSWWFSMWLGFEISLNDKQGLVWPGTWCWNISSGTWLWNLPWDPLERETQETIDFKAQITWPTSWSWL